MAKAKVQKKKKIQKGDIINLNLTKENYLIIAAGIVIIIIGYILMSEKSVDGFNPTVLAPIFLVFGYLVVIPIGILFKKEWLVRKNKTSETDTQDLNKAI
jgi:NAD/NADP transhydrogenase beta subunit